jgi:septum formation protein
METVTDSTMVHFRELTREEIDYYIDNFRPFDKAGGYGIQEWIGYAAITGIDGSFYNVMGFPVHKVYEELIKFANYGTER